MATPSFSLRSLFSTCPWSTRRMVFFSAYLAVSRREAGQIWEQVVANNGAPHPPLLPTFLTKAPLSHLLRGVIQNSAPASRRSFSADPSPVAPELPLPFFVWPDERSILLCPLESGKEPFFFHTTMGRSLTLAFQPEPPGQAAQAVSSPPQNLNPRMRPRSPAQSTFPSLPGLLAVFAWRRLWPPICVSLSFMVILERAGS